MDDALTMLIGPAAAGSMLEIGVLDIDDPVVIRAMCCGRSSTDSWDEEVTTMRHSKKDIEQAARRFEELAKGMDPATMEVLHTDDLREHAVVLLDEVTLPGPFRAWVDSLRRHPRTGVWWSSSKW